MSYKLEVKKNKIEVEIKISPEKWEECLQKLWRRKGKFSIQGFRRQSSRKVIENNMAKECFWSSIDIAFADEYNEFLDKNLDIEPISQPDVKLKNLKKKELY